jgi:hypothetical protein
VTDALETAGHAEELARRLFVDAVGAFELFSVYVGDVLGLYRVVRERGAVSPAELAEAAGIDARYAREWFEGQAAAGQTIRGGGGIPYADYGGHGRSSIEIARAYPRSPSTESTPTPPRSSARTSTSPRAASTTAFASTPVTPPTVASPGPTS